MTSLPKTMATLGPTRNQTSYIGARSEFWGGWQAVSLGGGVTVMEKRKFWQGG